MDSRVRSSREDRRILAQRSVAQVLADVVCNLQDILHAEVRLAEAEARAELRALRSAGALILIGVLAGLLSGFFLLLAVVAALSLVISVWIAALIVAIGMAALCAIVLRAGVNLGRTQTAKSARTAEEQAAWTVRPSV
jgi:Flp pilus assembly protein TadB